MRSTNFINPRGGVSSDIICGRIGLIPRKPDSLILLNGMRVLTKQEPISRGKTINTIAFKVNEKLCITFSVWRRPTPVMAVSWIVEFVVRRHVHFLRPM